MDIAATYDPSLVALSFAVAMSAAFLALELAGRVAEAEAGAARLWLCAGSIAMGLGIWSMHFIGMLACEMPMTLAYDVPTTLLSLAIGIGASALAIYVSSRRSIDRRQVLVGGVLLGLGISGMHYTGMAAMRMPAHVVWNGGWIAISVVIGVVAAIASIWISARLVGHSGISRKALAAFVMSLGISGMHYAGMEAAAFVLHEPTVASVGADDRALALSLALAALIILGFTHLTVFFDVRLGAERRLVEGLSTTLEVRAQVLEEQTEALRAGEQRLERAIAERARAEQQASYLSLVLDESTNEIYVFDADSLRFLSANKGAMENTGFGRIDFASMTPADLLVDHDHLSLRRMLAPLRSGERRFIVIEAVQRRRDGSTYPVRAHLQMHDIDEGSVFAASIVDITEYRSLEAELVQAKKLESIGQLAAGIAHEINTPTQFVGDNIRFLEDGFRDLLTIAHESGRMLDASNERSNEDTTALSEALECADVDYLAEEIPQAIEQSLDGVARITKIVRAMKEFSHPGGAERELVDFNKIVSNAITVASNEWKYVAEVETDLDEGLPFVPCYPQEVSQVVLNLVVNAAHAIAGTPSAERGEKGCIHVATRGVESGVELVVTDTGTGVPEAIRDRIFDPFFTTKEVGKGTGQGLSMAYATIVERHGGLLGLEPAPGQGARFVVRLPLSQAPAAGAVAASG